MPASTQNQALSALLFLCREVLQADLPWMDGVVRAERPKHVPVVVTQNEVRAQLVQLEGMRWPVVSLLYSSGMRLPPSQSVSALTVRSGRYYAHPTERGEMGINAGSSQLPCLVE